MHKLYVWFQGLPWVPAFCFAVAFFIFCFIAVLLVDLAFRRFEAWRERRAIRERNWIVRQQRVQLIIDAQREREEREDVEQKAYSKRLAVGVWRDRVQQHRESKQFHVAAAFRDVKGVTRS